ncbi:MAG: cupin domain-containing protein, partial [Proteobacteria bacterium]|nr:cupin domain-containing protein [Pseudomonadota bacterium]
FTPEQTLDLDPGDMLYLPPRWAHDGVALGACMTCSIGFRAPAAQELARELMHRIADAVGDDARAPALYRDPDQPAVAAPGRIPPQLRVFARQALAAMQRDALALPRALGEVLSEPKPDVWFERASAPRQLKSLVLDRRTRMLYDEHHVFINGEAHRMSGQGAALLRRLADRRMLGPDDLRGADPALRALLKEWCEAGWLHPADRAADRAA